MHPLQEARKELRRYASKKKAKLLGGYFKTGPGEYAEGDIFLGVQVPSCRRVSVKFQGLPFEETLKLLRSPIHEERFLALLILIRKYSEGRSKERERIFKAYLKHTRFINNWDLVDLSAPNIAGAFLLDKDTAVLYRLAKSDLLWERRIAILATFAFLKNKRLRETIEIAEILLSDKQELIYKAVGWALRELGKRDLLKEEEFLQKHYSVMPRTMLRYAIERFPERKRRGYLRKK